MSVCVPCLALFCTLHDLLAVTVEGPDTVGTPKTGAGVDRPGYSNVVIELGDLPIPGGSQVTPGDIGTVMGPEPVPVPSGTRTAAPFLTTGTSTHPGAVRLAAVGKVGGPGLTCGTKVGTSVRVYAAIAGITVAAVCPKVQAVSKVAFFGTSVAVLRRVGAGVITDPVLVPFVTRRIIPGIKRVPGDGAGIKFSIVVPFVGVFELLVIISSLFDYIVK